MLGKLARTPPPTPHPQDKISSPFGTDNQGSHVGAMKPVRWGKKNTHVKAVKCVEMSVEIHLLFHTLHQLCANCEQTTLKSQAEG